MLEEQGVVVAVDQQFISVRIQRQSSCGHCAVNNDCSTAHFSKLFGQKYTEIKVFTQSSVNIGDRVTIGFQEQALLKGALVLYLLPLLGLLVTAGSYEILAHQSVVPAGEFFTALCGLLGFIGGLLGARSFSNKTAHDVRYQPIILKTNSL